MTPRRKISEATEALFKRVPGFGSIILGLELVERNELKTMATDAVHLFYNSEFVDWMTIAETTFILWHEAKHVWLKHFMRLLDEPDHTLKNVSFDLAINSMDDAFKPSQRLLDRFCFPGVGKFAQLPAGKDGEWYAKALKGQAQPQPQQGQGSSKKAQDAPGGSGGKESAPGQENASEGKPDASGEASGEGQSSQTGDGQEMGDGSGQGQAGQGSQGMDLSDVPSLGDILPHPGIDGKDSAEAAEQRWTELVTQGMQAERMCGRGQGWFCQQSQEMLGESKVDWRMLLRRFMTRNAPVGWTYQRPNRRSGWNSEVIKPAHRSKQGCDGAILADTSGSMWSDLNEVVVPELNKILRSLKRAGVTLMQCDTRVIEDAERKFTAWDLPIKVPPQWKGGGGTNLSPGFEAVSKRRGQFKYLVCVTDMEWNYQAAPDPKVPVLWVVVGSWKQNNTNKPKFGQVVKV